MILIDLGFQPVLGCLQDLGCPLVLDYPEVLGCLVDLDFLQDLGFLADLVLQAGLEALLALKIVNNYSVPQLNMMKPGGP